MASTPPLWSAHQMVPEVFASVMPLLRASPLCVGAFELRSRVKVALCRGLWVWLAFREVVG